jgi:predicted Ser/Thr protein kinase
MLQQTTLTTSEARKFNVKALGRFVSYFVLRPVEYTAECSFYVAGIGFVMDFLLRFLPSPAIESLWPMVLFREAAAPLLNFLQAVVFDIKALPVDSYKAVPLALSLTAWFARPAVKRKLRRAQEKLADTSAESLFVPRPSTAASLSDYELPVGDDFSSARLIDDETDALATGSPIATSANEVLRTIGRFELTRELGRGPAGAVYKALDLKLGRIVAVKALLPEGLPKNQIGLQREKLYREARTAAKLTHPGIVAVYDVAEDSLGNPYIVMEYIDGESLAQALHQRHSEEPLSLAERLELAIQISKTLDYAHRIGIIHRDIKPSNILLTAEGHAKVADFGIAMHLMGDSVDGGRIPGTPAFIAPELLNGAPATAASDIFSLGVVMYWMFTGEIPFTGNTVTEIVHQVAYADPIPARRLNWALPQDLDRVLRRCLAKKPSERYASAGEVCADLIALRDGKLETARMSA